MINKARIHLKKIFGYDEFRPLQLEIIENILNRQDTLVIMPTGGGKSLCYQIPALLFEGLTVVVSPLISLMKDQVEQLTELGVSAVVLNSSISYSEYQNNIARIMRNEIKLVYLAPETLLMQKTLAMLSAKQVDCLTIDEAHCISEWGHDFRPEYRQIVNVRKQFPKAVCIALTATATPRVQEDIKNNLHFKTSNEFIASFDRKNLFLQIIQKNNPIKQTIEFVKKFPNQSGIIYCLTRDQVDEIAAILTNKNFSVKPYHAGLPDTERHQNQELFIRDDVQIMVATIAFGMGINKPNIRFILHYDLPKNIESYYQQIGRAGRDGLRADCLLLFSYSDIHKIKYFINQLDEKQQIVANIHLNALVRLAETNDCRRIPLLTYFGEEYSILKCDMCDNCLSGKEELIDVTIPAQKFFSCVKRTGEIFGAGHIIDVLRGSKSQKILDYNHDKLPTYGIGKEYSKQQWFYLSRQFIHKGLLSQDSEFGSLKLDSKAWDVMRGKEQFFGKLIEEQRKDFTKTKEKEQVYDETLFEKLRQKRKELADKSKVPPYVIFPDKTLIEMAIFFPQTEENLKELHGIGAIKFERYGHVFLELINQYCRSNNIKEKPKQTKILPRVSPEHAKKLKHVFISEEYNSGKSIEEISTEFDIKLNTAICHLFKYITEGNSLRASDEFINLSSLSSEQKNSVFDTLDKFGSERLTPIFEFLNKQVSYDELHLLRLHYLIKNQ